VRSGRHRVAKSITKGHHTVTKNVENCRNCAFWGAASETYGRCQRRSPTGLAPMVDAHGEVVVDIWPRTSANDFCGDFELKDAQ
jgi:hypothetical protein